MDRNSKGQLKDVIKSEYVKCASDPVYFLKKYCVVQHPIKGKIPFHLYDFQEKTVADLVKHRFNIKNWITTSFLVTKSDLILNSF